jgi:hypothetical protein
MSNEILEPGQGCKSRLPISTFFSVSNPLIILRVPATLSARLSRFRHLFSRFRLLLAFVLGMTYQT